LVFPVGLLCAQELKSGQVSADDDSDDGRRPALVHVVMTSLHVAVGEVTLVALIMHVGIAAKAAVTVQGTSSHL
jgi:hypothetical protein